MQILVILLSVFIIIFVVKKSKKKKEEREKDKKEEQARMEQREETDIFLSALRNWKSVPLPSYFFEKHFYGYDESEVTIEEKIQKTKNNFSSMVNSLDTYINGLSILENFKNTSLFFTQEAQLKEYNEKFTPEKVEEQISDDIIILLPSVGPTVKMFRLYGFLMSYYFNIIVPHLDTLYQGLAMNPQESEHNRKCHEQSALNCQNIYNEASFWVWEHICKQYPQYDNNMARERFINLVLDDKLAFNSWKVFYIRSLMAIKDELTEIFDNPIVKEKMEQCTRYSVHEQIKNGFSPYSSIHEIDNFDNEEINRIVELYKSREIKGAYSKAKDPHYSNNKNEEGQS